MLVPSVVLSSDWTILESQKNNCSIGTLEKINGNLKYPSLFQLAFSKNQRNVFAVIQNLEWDLKTRETTLYFEFNDKIQSVPAILSKDMALLRGADFLTILRKDFKKGLSVNMLNSKKNRIAKFSLAGFTNALENFSDCAGISFATILPESSTNNKNISSSKEKPSVASSNRLNIGVLLKKILLLGTAAACATNDGCLSGIATAISGKDPYDYNLKGSNTSRSSSSSASSDKQCSYDFDCDYGEKCIKNGYGKNMCVEFRNAKGAVVSSGDRNPQQCSRNNDCPSGYKCDWEYKICLKR